VESSRGQRDPPRALLEIDERHERNSCQRRGRRSVVPVLCAMVGEFGRKVLLNQESKSAVSATACGRDRLVPLSDAKPINMRWFSRDDILRFQYKAIGYNIGGSVSSGHRLLSLTEDFGWHSI
jgi:hypothetical protein